MTVKVLPVSRGTVQLTGSGERIMICSGDLTRVGSGGDLMICSVISGGGSGLALDTDTPPPISTSSSFGLGRRSGCDGVVAVVGVFLLCALAAEAAVEAVAVLPERI